MSWVYVRVKAEVLSDKKTLQFASGIKVRKGRVWTLTSRLQNYIDGHVPVNETNYRVVMGDLSQLTRGTKCYSMDNWASSSSSSSSNMNGSLGSSYNPQSPYNKPTSGHYKPFVFNDR